MADEITIDWRDMFAGGPIELASGDDRVVINAPTPAPPLEMLSILRGPEGPPGPAFGDDLPDFTLIFDNQLV